MSCEDRDVGRARQHAGRWKRGAVRALRERLPDDRPERERLGLTRLEPVSREFGFERGKPIDRFYIERFLDANRADVAGRVLEVAEPTYTRWFGDDRVTQSDVLHRTGVPEATIVGDLMTGEGLPDSAFDCFICTQTLHVIEDLDAAVRGIRDTLKPGGVVLATVPGTSQTSREDRRDWGDWRRFTRQGAERAFVQAGFRDVTAVAHGNVLVCAAFLYGFAAEELTSSELSYEDPEYELLVTVRAVR